MATANERLRDTSIRHAAELARYDRGLSDRLVRLLNSADDDILAKLAARLAQIEERGFDMGPRTTERLRQLDLEIKVLNDAIYGRVHDQLADELTDFAGAEAGFQKAALDAALAVDVGTSLPAPALLRAIVEEAPMEGRLLRAWTDGMAQGRMDRISQAIRLGMVQGEGTDAIVRRIKGTKAARYGDGILYISRRSAQSIVRTAVNHVSNQAAQHTWNANAHVVKGWSFVATLDSRTTSTCASKDGKVYPVGEGPIPPLHIRCRSISVAVTKSFRELGLDRDELTPAQRASMDGAVAGSVKYPEWLRSQSTAVQEQVLGKKRAELFSQGKLSFADLVATDGSLATLDELKKRYPDLLR
jgi:SPP1 gp7 family putative phage head morphogenesis protein